MKKPIAPEVKKDCIEFDYDETRKYRSFMSLNELNEFCRINQLDPRMVRVFVANKGVEIFDVPIDEHREGIKIYKRQNAQYTGWKVMHPKEAKIQDLQEEIEKIEAEIKTKETK